MRMKQNWRKAVREVVDGNGWDDEQQREKMGKVTEARGKGQRVILKVSSLLPFFSLCLQSDSHLPHPMTAPPPPRTSPSSPSLGIHPIPPRIPPSPPLHRPQPLSPRSSRRQFHARSLVNRHSSTLTLGHYDFKRSGIIGLGHELGAMEFDGVLGLGLWGR